VILATNIAETSVTVPGVRFVIDGGKSKVKRFHNTLGFESLVGKAISKSSADQRKGRAGREAPGQCYRLYTEKSYNEFEPQMSPEIQRSNLSSAVLAIKARDLDTSSGGFSDIHTFPFLTPPSEEALSRACLQLHLIGALDAKTGTITPLGRRIARLPLPPQLGRVVLEAAQPSRNCLREVIDIVSCLSVESIFLPAETEDARDAAAAARATLFRRSGDHMTLLATLQSYAAESGDRKRWAREHMCSHRALKAAMDVRKQLLSQCAAQRMLPKSTTTSSPEKEDILPPPSDHARIYDEATEGIILQCFLRGFVDHLARVYPDKAYRLMNGSNGGGGGGGSHVVAIHPSSVLFGRKLSAFMFNEVVFTTKAYLRAVSVIRLKWLDEILPPMGMAAAAAEGGGDGGGGAEVMEG
jgi:ATP-dependent RNA helicase DHR2